MGARVEELAKKLEESCREFATVVEGLSDADWRTVTAAETLEMFRRTEPRRRPSCAD
jgi:hypothetical protein